jgi:RNA ligase
VEPIYKYPRTHHIEGSRFQPGDEELQCVPLRRLAGRHLVIEEKMDGANAAISFGADHCILLQSRGHFLAGGPRERHFALFKAWARTHETALRAVLGTRYVLYGEWLYAKHTIYYDRLSHYFLEFDLLDKQAGHFLSTPRRRAVLAGLPIAPVQVLYAGRAEDSGPLAKMVGPSRFIGPGHLERLRLTCGIQHIDAALALRETDPSADMEGLYIKVEEGDTVRDRYKFVRAGFLTTVRDADSHWLDRPIVPNGLRTGVDLYAQVPP